MPAVGQQSAHIIPAARDLLAANKVSNRPAYAADGGNEDDEEHRRHHQQQELQHHRIGTIDRQQLAGEEAEIPDYGEEGDVNVHALCYRVRQRQ
jgi:hypothetical protein